jgi:hypothetical protein
MAKSKSQPAAPALGSDARVPMKSLKAKKPKKTSRGK